MIEWEKIINEKLKYYDVSGSWYTSVRLVVTIDTDQNVSSLSHSSLYLEYYQVEVESIA